jgi:pyruvate/2-oxoglutarate dehydrogenase complex dihydrolipoamide dehydrogenase (E3) component
VPISRRSFSFLTVSITSPRPNHTAVRTTPPPQMAESKHYDLISLGCGEAGKYIAWTLASQGKSCAVIEQKWVGGSCPNIACLPSKNVIYSAKIVHAERLGTFGLQANAAAVDMKEVIERKRAMVRGLVDMHLGKFKASGAELVMGRGKFVGKKTIEVEDSSGNKRILTGDTVIVSTGSRAIVDDRLPGLKDAKPLTHIELLELETLPEHLVVLGGGYIGLELAQAWRRLGASVTVIDRNKRLLKKEDPDISEFLQSFLTKEGIKFYTGANVTSVTGVSGSEVTVEGSSDDTSFTIRGSHILVAAGRFPNTENIGLDVAGIDLTPSKHIKVDEYLHTSSENVFAVGDCAGSPHFTHIAFDDFRVVVSVLQGNSKAPRSTKGRQVPWTLFTSPEVAHIGLREVEAKAAGIEYRLAKAPMLVFLRTRTLGETEGFAKALIAPDDSILGFTAIGPGTGELLPVVQLAMQEKLPYQEIGGLVITHPTLSEGLVALFSGVPPRS